MVMHPIKPALEGKDLTNNKDPDGTPLFVETLGANDTITKPEIGRMVNMMDKYVFNFAA